MLKQSDFFHGTLFTKLLDQKELTIRKHIYSSSYIINNRAYYIKYSRNRISPWIFTFSKKHVEEILDLNNKYQATYIILICNEDGICCLKFEELKSILAIENNNYPKWIRADRQKREKYTVTGSDGKLKYKIGDNCLENSIIEEII